MEDVGCFRISFCLMPMFSTPKQTERKIMDIIIKKAPKNFWKDLDESNKQVNHFNKNNKHSGHLHSMRNNTKKCKRFVPNND